LRLSTVWSFRRLAAQGENVEAPETCGRAENPPFGGHRRADAGATVRLRFRHSEEEVVAAVPKIGRATEVERPERASELAAHGLYQRNYPRVLGFCRNRLRNREEAEDAAQTTFYYAVGALQRGVLPAAESAWLFKIAHNVCLNRWAANSRRNRLEVARDPHVLQEVAPAREASDDDLIALHEALGHLTEQQRRAILLREWQGLSYREIADQLGLSQAAVETLIFRARRSLARHLQGDRKLRSGLDLASLLAGLKSLFTGTGAAVKIAAGIAALAAAGGIAGPQIENRLQHHAPAPTSPRTAPGGAAAAPVRDTGGPALGRVGAVRPARDARAHGVPSGARRTGARPGSPSGGAPIETPVGGSEPVSPPTPTGAPPPGAPTPSPPTSDSPPTAPLSPPALPPTPSTPIAAPALPASPLPTPTTPSLPALPIIPDVPTLPALPTAPLPDPPPLPLPQVPGLP
jgi:RNA polymerase sigma factor (sigma-70 family)